MELCIGDLIVYTYRGDLELAQIEGIGTTGAVLIRLPSSDVARYYSEYQKVYKVVWKNDNPQIRGETTFGKIKSKLGYLWV